MWLNIIIPSLIAVTMIILGSLALVGKLNKTPSKVGLISTLEEFTGDCTDISCEGMVTYAYKETVYNMKHLNLTGFGIFRLGDVVPIYIYDNDPATPYFIGEPSSPKTSTTSKAVGGAILGLGVIIAGVVLYSNLKKKYYP